MDETTETNRTFFSRAGYVGTVVRDSGKLEWSEFTGPRALRCLPAIIVPLTMGMAFHKPVQALLAAAGAFAVGFGSFQRLYHSRFAPMLIASLAMALSAFVGTSVRHWDIAIILAATAWGFLRGLSTSIGPGAVYIGTQSIVFLLLSTGFKLPADQAFPLILYVLAAGLFQTLVISVCRLLYRESSLNKTKPKPWKERLNPVRGARLALHTVRRNALRRQAELWSAVRICITIGVSAALSRLSHDHHNYWMPMTTAIILQQDMHQTYIRALSRIGGTILGVGLATALAAVLRPTQPELILLTVVFAWSAYSMLKVNYFLFAACITAYIVFLLSFAGLPELSVIATRTEFTFFGAALALFAHLNVRKRTLAPEEST